MRKILPLLLLSPALTLFQQASFAATPLPNIVELQTNLGTITILVNHAKAPLTSKNFITYAQSGFYKDTLIHRVVKDFVVQGGGFDKASGQLKPTNPPIKNEASNGLSNITATIAMARTNDPNSATSQFFINLADKNKTFLDYKANASNPAGYAVFGKVIKGMAIVKNIGNLATANELPLIGNYEMVTIDNVYTSLRLDNTASITRISINGKGKVTSVPAGINCGTVCSKSLPTSAKTIKLTATAAAGYYFSGWRGDCSGTSASISLSTLSGNHNCSALFAKAAVAQ